MVVQALPPLRLVGLFFGAEVRRRVHPVGITMLQDIPFRCERLVRGIASSIIATSPWPWPLGMPILVAMLGDVKL